MERAKRWLIGFLAVIGGIHLAFWILVIAGAVAVFND